MKDLMYKYSFYNIETHTREESVNIWNSRTGSIVVLNRDVFENLIAENFDYKGITSLIDDLLKQGIVVNRNFDEFQSIVFKSKQKQLQYTDKFTVVIAPTLDCNFNCFYCFEHSHDTLNNVSEITSDIVSNIIEFIVRNVKKLHQIKYLDIHWFGGEPLLKYDNVILPILDKLRIFCEEQNITLDSYIVTNGFYLTKEKFKRFIIECHNSHFQITFDGTKQEYAYRKGVSEKSYDIVKKNLMDLSEFLIENNLNYSIDVRLNADNNNIENLKLFVEEIKQTSSHNNIRFHLGRLRDYTACKNDYFSLDQFWNAAADFNRFLNKEIKIEEPKPIWCGQYCVNCICIGPEGELYKCEHDFGKKERVVGDIYSGLYYNSYYCNYMNIEVSEKCERCKLFPVCLGGCPSIRYDSEDKRDCEYSIEYLKSVVNNIINKAGK